jgi:hypothetical protein
MLYQRGCHLDAERFPDRASALVQNQAEKGALVEAGRAHGILVYDDSEPIGWCQFGPAEELPLPGATRLDRRIPPLGAGVRWRITCFVTVIRRRRRGVANTALRSALQAIRERGGGLVEAYPTLTPHNPNWVHAGTVSLFQRAGFVIVGRPSKKYVVMQREVRRRTLLWPLLSRYGRRTGALISSSPGVTTGTALDATHSRLHRIGSAHGVSTRLHQTLFQGSATPPLPETRLRAPRPRPRNSSVPPRRPIKTARSRPKAVSVRE